MFTINDDLSIYATRGDTVFFTVTAEENGVPYYFEAGDVLRMKIYGKKDAESVVLEKCFPVTARTDRFTILLTEEDTKIDEVISKPRDYWYEIELNPFTNPQTIIGYDEDGPKVFKLFPEGQDSEIPEIKPEDIPVVDIELDMTSNRPVQNQAISRAIVNLEAAYQVTKEEVTKATKQVNHDVAVEKARIDNLISGAVSDDAEVLDIRVGADGHTYSVAGEAVRAQYNLFAETSKIEWVYGAWNASGPIDYPDNKLIVRTASALSKAIVSLSCPKNMSLHICAFADDGEVRFLANDNTFESTTDNLGEFKYVNIAKIREEYPNFEIHAVLRYTNYSTDLEAEDIAKCVVSSLRGHEDFYSELKRIDDRVSEYGIKFAERPENGLDNFSVEVNYHETMEGELLFTDYGVLALPMNYTPDGEATRLIILCQGTGERTDATTNPLSNHGWAYFLSKGYAVMDMNGMANGWGSKMGFPVIDQHYCNKYLLQSYKKGYEYVTRKYNLKKEVFVAGISMGGGASALIVQSRVLPVIAHVAFCPALSVYKQDYMNPWGGENQQKTIAGQWGFADWQNASPSQAYFLQNIDKIKGFDNLLINTIGNTKDEANRNYGNAAEEAAYNELNKIYPVPLKIWHCADDPTVLMRYSTFMVNMIRNADGQAWLRTMPSGGHVGGWNNGTVSDTDINGNTVTTSVPFYESVLFLQQYE